MRELRRSCSSAAAPANSPVPRIDPARRAGRRHPRRVGRRGACRHGPQPRRRRLGRVEGRRRLLGGPGGVERRPHRQPRALAIHAGHPRRHRRPARRPRRRAHPPRDHHAPAPAHPGVESGGHARGHGRGVAGRSRGGDHRRQQPHRCAARRQERRAAIEDDGTVPLDFGFDEEAEPAAPEVRPVTPISAPVAQAPARPAETATPAADDDAAAPAGPQQTATPAPAPEARPAEPEHKDPAERPRKKKSRKPAVPAWEDVLLGVRSNGNS